MCPAHSPATAKKINFFAAHASTLFHMRSRRSELSSAPLRVVFPVKRPSTSKRQRSETPLGTGITSRGASARVTNPREKGKQRIDPHLLPTKLSAARPHTEVRQRDARMLALGGAERLARADLSSVESVTLPAPLETPE